MERRSRKCVRSFTRRPQKLEAAQNAQLIELANAQNKGTIPATFMRVTVYV